MSSLSPCQTSEKTGPLCRVIQWTQDVCTQKNQNSDCYIFNPTITECTTCPDLFLTTCANHFHLRAAEGILPLLRASLPLFRAVELLASSGLSQSLALDLFLGLFCAGKAEPQSWPCSNIGSKVIVFLMCWNPVRVFSFTTHRISRNPDPVVKRER